MYLCSDPFSLHLLDRFVLILKKVATMYFTVSRSLLQTFYNEITGASLLSILLMCSMAALAENSAKTDTLILDGEYITIQRDTGEFDLEPIQDTSISQTEKSGSGHRNSWYGALDVQMSFLNFNYSEQPAGYVNLTEWLSESRFADVMNSRSVAFNLKFFTDREMRQFRRYLCSYRIGLGFSIQRFTLPSAFVEDSKSVSRDSVMEFRRDGDDLLMVYFVPFGMGLGEADTVYTKWERGRYGWTSVNGFCHVGGGIRPRNSPWHFGGDVCVGVSNVLRVEGRNPLGWVASDKGYYQSRASNISNRFSWLVGAQIRIERTLEGISQGFFKDARIGFTVCHYSKQNFVFNDFALSLRQLGVGFNLLFHL
jgi:hypothetical protein